MKKLLAILLVVAMVACLFVGCKPAETKTPETSAAPTETAAPTEAQTDAPTEPAKDYSAYHVAMITDYGDITDQSFNQATYEGCKAFCDERSIDFKYYKPTGDSTAERVAMVDQAYADGYRIIVCPGFAFAGTLVEAAPEYPDAQFIALDVALGDLLGAAVGADYDYNPDNWNLADYVDLSNVYSAVYQEELAGYMAGYAAVMLGYTKLGYLGGMAVPAVVRYGYGFVQGADDAAAINGATVEMKYVYGNQFFGDPDITAYMDTWYAAGTEVVFACGGGIFTSAAEAAAKVNAKVIGVDVDQAPIIDAYGEGMTVTSAMKGLAATVTTLLGGIIEDDNWAAYAGQIETLGLVSEDPTANYVQIPASTQWDDNFSEDDYKALVADMFSGTITVSNDIAAEPALEAITVDYQGNIK